MKEIGKEHNLIRQYLLGKLTETEQERLEELFMTDPEYREEMLIVEEELIEGYLDNSLSLEDKGRVASHLLSTSEQVQRLEVARALNRYCADRPTASVATTENQLNDRVPDRPTMVSSSSVFRKRVVVYSLAAVLLAVALAGIWSLLSTWRDPDFGREFALLNSREGRSRKPDLVVTLFPGTLRGSESVKVSPGGRENTAELMLVLTSGGYSSYRVTLRGGNIQEQYSVSNLEAVLSNNGRSVPVRISTTHLAPGDYFLELAGLTPTGAFEGVADYRFRLSN
ncbi:MAG TPA: hypothetical protein VGO68_05210 [Pyrinomonadaceae bacterium]|jgi:hypothetical protein|nr:hypothetical protein [Pyrinomonadaceae bacterium]